MKRFKDKVVVITGAAQGIGKCIADEFKKEGAHICMIDIQQNDYFQGDISDKDTLERFVKKVIDDYGHVDFLINNAAPLFKGLSNCSYEEFVYALNTGVTAAFYLTKLLQNYFNKGACIINISSSRIHALTHALAVTLSNKVRVNSISPGWIDTNYTLYKGADALQHPAGRVGNPLDISNMVLFLCSDQAGFITGENICIDGGMTKQMIYHNDNGWSLH